MEKKLRNNSLNDMRGILIAVLLVIGGCVNPAVLTSWEGVPVGYLDTHPFFMSLPMTTAMRHTPTGVLEVRAYVNSHSGNICNTGDGFCAPELSCNNVFYISNGLVTKYKLLGHCRTVEFLRPEL